MICTRKVVQERCEGTLCEGKTRSNRQRNDMEHESFIIGLLNASYSAKAAGMGGRGCVYT